MVFRKEVRQPHFAHVSPTGFQLRFSLALVPQIQEKVWRGPTSTYKMSTSGRNFSLSTLSNFPPPCDHARHSFTLQRKAKTSPRVRHRDYLQCRMLCVP